ncbi:MAG: lamin tail domain-containing protein, partial [Bacteroidales bacterium]|nr:lamin tail domain-containing protein [Bacteroidales bacterium]
MKKKNIVILIALFLNNVVFTQVVINEYCASNLNGIFDEDNETSDWIELYNNSDVLMNLTGYHLSDDLNNKVKWTFPEVHLNPHSHLLIYASGKDRKVVSTKYQTIIFPGDSWQYLVPSAEIGDDWKGSGFDASSWETGNSGFGYGDNDDATVLPNILSI